MRLDPSVNSSSSKSAAAAQWGTVPAGIGNHDPSHVVYDHRPRGNQFIRVAKGEGNGITAGQAIPMVDYLPAANGLDFNIRLQHWAMCALQEFARVPDFIAVGILIKDEPVTPVSGRGTTLAVAARAQNMASLLGDRKRAGEAEEMNETVDFARLQISGCQHAEGGNGDTDKDCRDTQGDQQFRQ